MNQKNRIKHEPLENLPSASLSRNDYCFCGSGKKYKKCCLEKNQSNSDIRHESFVVKLDALTPEESQQNHQPLSEEDQALMTTLYNNFYNYPDTVDSEDCEYFQKLEALHLKYPDNPMIFNYIAKGYDLLGLKDRMEELIAKTYDIFPDYLFAKTAVANTYFRDGFPEKAFDILNRAHTLKQLYPNRTVFHISEVRAFQYCMVQYHCAKKNVPQAEVHLNILEKFLDEDDEILQSAQAIFRNAELFSQLSNLKERLPYFQKKAMDFLNR